MSERTEHLPQSTEPKFDLVRRHLLIEYDPRWVHGLAKLLDQEYENNRGDMVELVFDRAYLVLSGNDTATMGFWPIATETAICEIQPGVEGEAGRGTFKRFGLLSTRQQTDRGLMIEVPEICLVYSNTDADSGFPISDGAGPVPDVFCPITAIKPATLQLG